MNENKIAFDKNPFKAYNRVYGVRLVPTWENSDSNVSVERLYKCWTCFDTQEVSNVSYDEDSNRYYDDGTKACPDCAL